MSQDQGDAVPAPIATILRLMMEQHRKTVTQLAREAEVDPGYLRRILDEKPKQNPSQMSIDAGIKIARVLGEAPEMFAVCQAKRLVFERLQIIDTPTTASIACKRGRANSARSPRRSCKRAWALPKA